MTEPGRSNLARAAVLVAAILLGAAALAVQGLLSPTSLPREGEYFLTDLARSRIGPFSVAAAAAMAFAFGFLLQAPPVRVGLSLVALFPLILVYEASRYSTSHNLAPFELMMVASMATPLMLVAWVGRALAQRAGRASWWRGA